jgi:hypothetical protein
MAFHAQYCILRAGTAPYFQNRQNARFWWRNRHTSMRKSATLRAGVDGSAAMHLTEYALKCIEMMQAASWRRRGELCASKIPAAARG